MSFLSREAGASKRFAEHTVRFIQQQVVYILGNGIFIIRVTIILLKRLSKAIYTNRDRLLGWLLFIIIVTVATFYVNSIIQTNVVSLGVQALLALPTFPSVIIVLATIFIIVIEWPYIGATLRALFSYKAFAVIISYTALICIVLLNVSLLPDQSTRIQALIALLSAFSILGLLAKFLAGTGISTPENSAYITDDVQAMSRLSPLLDSQKMYADQLAAMLRDCYPSSVAVTGDWGVGKNFVLEKALQQLATKDSERIIKVVFQPWRYASDEAMIKGFYDQISAEVSESIKGLQQLALPVANRARQFIDKQDSHGFLGMVFDTLKLLFVKDGQTPEDVISRVLKEENRQLVVIIDDIERHYAPGHIFTALQLAHFIKSVPNVQVIQFYVKDEVLDALTTVRHRPQRMGQDRYLEKFSDIEISLPEPRPTELHQLFMDFVDQRSSMVNFPADVRELTIRDFRSVDTPRAAIRLFNEFSSYYVNRERGGNL